MKSVPVSDSLRATVDGEDFDLVSRYKWSLLTGAKNHKYAIAYISDEYLLMHRLISGVTGKSVVDHKNGDGLDNRRKNLRICSHAQNIWSSRINDFSKKTSRFKGVYLRKNGKWRADIKIHGKKKCLGTFVEETAAAQSYDMAAMKYFGEFACTNQDMGLY